VQSHSGRKKTAAEWSFDILLEKVTHAALPLAQSKVGEFGGGYQIPQMASLNDARWRQAITVKAGECQRPIGDL